MEIVDLTNGITICKNMQINEMEPCGQGIRLHVKRKITRGVQMKNQKEYATYSVGNPVEFLEALIKKWCAKRTCKEDWDKSGYCFWVDQIGTTTYDYEIKIGDRDVINNKYILNAISNNPQTRTFPVKQSAFPVMKQYSPQYIDFIFESHFVGKYQTSYNLYVKFDERGGHNGNK